MAGSVRRPGVILKNLDKTGSAVKGPFEQGAVQFAARLAAACNIMLVLRALPVGARFGILPHFPQALRRLNRFPVRGRPIQEFI